MLSDSPIFTILPASDRDRARAFYGEKLGLTPSQVQPNGDLEYETGGIRFYVTKSVGKSPGEFTQASWVVEDVEPRSRTSDHVASSSRSTTCPR
jgi:catechol 2,3-dioxygenase-like lactoylglutathione lyase family enzyme